MGWIFSLPHGSPGMAGEGSSGGDAQVEPGVMISKVDDAAGDINAIYQGLNPLFPIFNSLQFLPGIGPYIGQIDPAVNLCRWFSSRLVTRSPGAGAVTHR